MLNAGIRVSKALFLAVAAALISVRASEIPIPNYSFEQPPVDPQAGVSPGHVSWQQTPKPADFQEFPEFQIFWFTLTGVFLNTPPSSTADHIDNMDGSQAAYLFSESRNAIYQDLTAQYEAGYSYKMTANITGSPNRPLPNGTRLGLTLFYRDGANQITPISTAPVTYNNAEFSGTHLREFSVTVPASSTGAWIGKPIGVMIKPLDTVDGVWDIEEVRLFSVREFIPIPNYSFEQPVVDAQAGVSPGQVSWQQAPKPDDFQEVPDFNYFWFTLTGVFINAPPTSTADHIDNADGNQVAYLFAESRNSISQELTSPYEAGYSYKMTVAITGSPNRPLPDGARLGLTLYYRDVGNQITPIATTPVIYSNVEFTGTHLRDYSVIVPAAKSAAWIGKPIGVMIKPLNTVDGVWDVENVRLTFFRETIDIPNFSFEQPVVDPQAGVSPGHFAWQQAPKPADFQEFPEFQIFWFTLTGVFANTAPNSPNNDHIDNMDGNQGAYLFSESRNGIYQDLTASYQPGVAYTLTAGVTGSPNRPLPNGSTLDLIFYYRDEAVSEQKPIKRTTITYNTADFTGTHLNDFSIALSPEETSAWIGKPIGVMIKPAQTVDGVWDIDNVRLTAYQPPRLRVRYEGNNILVSWNSDINRRYRFRSSIDLINWQPAMVIAGTGGEMTVSFPIHSPEPTLPQRFLSLEVSSAL